ncbi:MAG: hypothetical protein MJE68_14495 [Proteobacteria bacterium]|nr:hypothetical protein [Pseudomonadota bacterium]
MVHVFAVRIIRFVRVQILARDRYIVRQMTFRQFRCEIFYIVDRVGLNPFPDDKRCMFDEDMEKTDLI